MISPVWAVLLNLNARKISQPGNHAHRMLLVFE